MKNPEIIEADLTNTVHASAILKVTDLYAQDSMGMEEPLGSEVKEKLIGELLKFPGTVCFIAFIDGKPAGVANCFFGFSTFNAAKVLNIHDLAVSPEFRNRGIGDALLSAVEKKAEQEGCCKITLEVRSDNRARNLYERFGFRYGVPRMLFMQKELTGN